MDRIENIYALTVQQPHAAAICGPKQVENRSWMPPPCQLQPGDWLAIHAGMKYDRQAHYSFPGDQIRGAIVAVAKYRCALTFDELRNLKSSWLAYGAGVFATGPICWLIDFALPLPAPIPCRGQLRLWKVRGPAAVQLAKFMKTKPWMQ